MILSRIKAATSKKQPLAAAENKDKPKVPDFIDLVDSRDYTGAVAILLNGQNPDELQTSLWVAYCYFHCGNYKEASDSYEDLTKKQQVPPDLFVFLACCQFYLGQYEESYQTALMGPKTALQNRLMFHVSHKLGDEKQLMLHHQQLQDTIEDQMCLAAIHYLRSHYQEAVEIYKALLASNRNFVALNVYLAMCYYKLDYFDVSLEVLQLYLQQYPDSVTALNLKACCHYKLYNGKAAETELKAVTSNQVAFASELIKHNMVVFRNGDASLQVMPPLVDVLPEARLNLVIYCLRRGDIQQAYTLIEDLEPSVPQEYIVKAIVLCLYGQQKMSKEHLKTAQKYFHLVGGSAAECDTVPGRQCMISCYFLLKQFDEVLVFLESIKSYFYNDDTFNYNAGQAYVSVGKYKEAEEALLLVKDDRLKNDYIFISALSKCFIMTGRSNLAWELYSRMGTSAESFNLLQLIANDCYKMGQFLYSAKAFDVLEKLDPNPEYWEGKRGACIGLFQLVVAGEASSEDLREGIQILQNSNNPQAERIVSVIVEHAKQNRIGL